MYQNPQMETKIRNQANADNTNFRRVLVKSFEFYAVECL